MAVPSDSLRNLPPEIRQCVYSYLLSDDGESTVRIRQRPATDDQSPYAQYRYAVIAMLRDPVYVARRQERPWRDWPSDVEEAHLQALEWISMNHIPKPNNKILSELIYELMGQERTRTKVGGHFQILKEHTQFRAAKIAQYDNMKQSSDVTKPGPALSFENYPILTENSEIFRYLSTTASDPNGLSAHCSTSSAQNLISLSSVSRFYRTECLQYLTSNTRFDFGCDGQALQRFCSTAPAELLDAIRSLRITVVEGYMSDLPALPNLCSLVIDLWPRNPARANLEDRVWGAQTEAILAGLGVVTAARARITLEMRWGADCERFESEYVDGGRWRPVVGHEEDGASDREGLLCRRRYELCANGETVVKGNRQRRRGEISV